MMSLQSPTRIIVGGDFVSTLVRFARKLLQRPFFITSPTCESLFPAISELLTKAKKEFSVMGYRQRANGPNLFQEMDDLIAKLRADRHDGIVAIGGGATLDFAKCVAAISASGEIVLNYLPDPPQKGRRLHQTLPVIAVPTLPGTGSEINHGAVLRSPSNIRRTLHFPILHPNVAILFPLFIHSTPLDILRDSVFDALTHCWEILWQLEPLLPPCRLHLASIIQSLLENFAAWLKGERTDERALFFFRLGQMASVPALPMPRSGWPLHCMEHVLPTFLEVSHAQGLRLLLPAFLAHLGRRHPPLLTQFGEILKPVADDWRTFWNTPGTPIPPQTFDPTQWADLVLKYHGHDGKLWHRPPLERDQLIAMGMEVKQKKQTLDPLDKLIL